MYVRCSRVLGGAPKVILTPIFTQLQKTHIKLLYRPRTSKPRTPVESTHQSEVYRWWSGLTGPDGSRDTYVQNQARENLKKNATRYSHMEGPPFGPLPPHLLSNPTQSKLPQRWSFNCRGSPGWKRTFCLPFRLVHRSNSLFLVIVHVGPCNALACETSGIGLGRHRHHHNNQPTYFKSKYYSCSISVSGLYRQRIGWNTSCFFLLLEWFSNKFFCTISIKK